jgi:hypothetical protein
MVQKVKMKLWKLQAIPGAVNSSGFSPWRAPYTVAVEMFVVAEDENQARQIADEHGRDENFSLQKIRPWLEEKYSTCELLVAGSEPRFLISDVRVW